MAISDQIQMLVSTFIFGILFQAAVAATLLYLRGHGSNIFRDHRRLVLVLFITFSALWAQFDFINFTVPSTSPTGCQVTIIASTLFDQAARVTIGSFLLWSVGHVKKTVVESYSLGTLMGIRIVMGVVFVAYSRPQFAPVCVARSDMLVVPVIVMVLDMIIAGILTIRAFTAGLFDIIREVRSSSRREQSKALVCGAAGFWLWILASIIMLLGIESTILLLRAGIPAIGLLVLVLILAIYPGAFLLPPEDDSTTPEARSPYLAPRPSAFGAFGASNGSPVRENGYTRRSTLFVVNPSDTRHDSQITSYLEETKTEGESNSGHPSTTRTAVQVEDTGSVNTGSSGGNQSSNRIFVSPLAAHLGAGGSAPVLAASRGSSLMSANKIEQSRIVTPQDISLTEAQQKQPRFRWSKNLASKGVRKIVSKPVDDAEVLSILPSSRIGTIDLETAVGSEREYQGASIGRSLVAQQPAPVPSREAWQKSNGIKRKEIRRGSSMPLALNATGKSSHNATLSVDANATSTSASLSPGSEDIRRRSPRVEKTLQQDIEKAYSLASRVQGGGFGFAKGNNPQAIMYVNDFVFDHPGTVKPITKGAPLTEAKHKPEQMQTKIYPADIFEPSTLGRSDSIIHRPRPYRPDSEKDRVLFPSEPSPHHKRSRSESSISSKKSSLQSHVGFISGMPALPEPPKSAAELRKLLPIDTESRTVDEGISLLFPAPPGVHYIPNRRSSVPSLPQILSSTPVGESFSKFLTYQETKDCRTSKRMRISLDGPSQNDGVALVVETPITNEHGIYLAGVNTDRTPAGSRDVSCFSASSSNVPTIGSSKLSVGDLEASNGKSQSTSNSSSEVGELPSGSRSAWASIHSPIPAVVVTTAQRTVRETYIRMHKDTDAGKSGYSPRRFRAPCPKTEGETNVLGNSENFLTTKFGSDEVFLPSPANSGSFLMDPSPVLQNNRQFLLTAVGPWPRRIGDELPAFSKRRKRLRSRAMPPPAPLLLSSKGTRATTIVRKPIVCTVEDTPETVLKEIQAQLRKFEESSTGSLDPLRHVPNDRQNISTPNEDKLNLLANLEKEMGQQQTHWMRMQHNFNRDSDSMILTPQIPLPSPPSEPSSSRSPLSVAPRPHTQRNSTRHSDGGESALTTSTQSSENSRASIWQRRLAEAHIEYMENVVALLDKRNVNFLSFQRAQLGSPTPPDSVDSESEPGTSVNYDIDQRSCEKGLARGASSPVEELKQTLWQPKPLELIIRIGHLWSPPQDSSSGHTPSHEPAAKTLRPTRQRSYQPLLVTSSNLWSKPEAQVNQPPVGLWGSKVICHKGIITHSKSQRPARKSKRITFLPDILESPSPLPHRNDTLGIFQFPWGEKSDSAVHDPIPMLDWASLDASILCPTTEMKSRPLDAELEEYSSPFFDDYEEDYGAESEKNIKNSFEESTLWEIANLLNSQDVPSRNSLLPPQTNIREDDDYESDASENPTCLIQSSQIAMCQATSIYLKPLPPLPLLQNIVKVETPRALEGGIQQPGAGVWPAYIPALNEDVVQISRPNADPKISWDMAIGAASSLPVGKAVTLWTQQCYGAAKRSPGSEHSSVKDNPHVALWSARQTTTMFGASVHHTDYRIRNEIPAAITTTRKHRVDATPLLTPKSGELWSPSKNSSPERHWISLSSINSYPNAESSPVRSHKSDKASTASLSARLSSLSSI